MMRPRDDRNNGSGTVGVLMVFSASALVIVTFLTVLFGPMSQSGCGCSSGEEAATFPTVRIKLTDFPEGDILTIRHLAGDPLILYNYKILLTDIDSGDSTVLGDLYGEITAGEQIELEESDTRGLGGLDYEKGKAYDIEIYSIEDNKLVFQKTIICE